MRSKILASVAGALLLAGASAASVSPTMSPAASPSGSGRITGVGGIFFRSKDPKPLAAWYHDVLGIQVEAWGGALLPYDALDHPPVVVWTPFKAETKYFEPSTREFMLNFAVDDLDAFSSKLAAKGVTVHPQPGDDHGRFAWIVDPDGTKIELWEPKR